MAYNKFILANGLVLLDLTKDDITTKDVRLGKKFHGKDGEAYTGEYELNLQEATFFENGVFYPDANYDGFSSVTIDVHTRTPDFSGEDVPSHVPMPVLIEKTINANGVYLASDEEADGFSKIIVDIEHNDSPLPIEIATEAEMTALLDKAEVGSVYKYVGETGAYENGALYVVEVSE